MDAPKTAEFAHIGKSVIIKGELSGSEDLYVDGTVEGSIQLQGNNLVIGPNGQVRASLIAKDVTVQGKVEGNIRASNRADLRKSAIVSGDIATQRIAIEEGAFFKGKVDIQKEPLPAVTAPVKTEPKPAAKVEPAPAVKSEGAPPKPAATPAVAAASSSGSTASSSSGNTPVTKH